jgi:serine/threonine protein kinase
MDDAPALHPGPAELAAFARGRLAPAARAEVARHVASCDACCRAVSDLPENTLIARVRAALASLGGPPTEAPPPPQPRDVADLPPELRNHPRYRIVKCLGAGGMGVVYQAEHRLMQRVVALKVLGRHWLQHPEAEARFLREVKAAARLTHANIVAAHDAERAGDLHFLVMEFVEGVDLARLVEKRGPLPAALACSYARQAALGLQHAHERGMVHRDVKPQNLMVTPKGQVKILDFGLARFGRERDAAASTAVGGVGPSGAALTGAGVVLGTPDYMAPEQALDAAAADVRSDIYSLGCTLYFLLTGRPPFPEGSSFEKLLAHVEATPAPVGGLRGDLPPGLDAVVGRMMEKEPAQRYPTAAEVAVG